MGRLGRRRNHRSGRCRRARLRRRCRHRQGDATKRAQPIAELARATAAHPPSLRSSGWFSPQPLRPSGCGTLEPAVRPARPGRSQFRATCSSSTPCCSSAATRGTSCRTARRRILAGDDRLVGGGRRPSRWPASGDAPWSSSSGRRRRRLGPGHARTRRTTPEQPACRCCPQWPLSARSPGRSLIYTWLTVLRRARQRWRWPPAGCPPSGAGGRRLVPGDGETEVYAGVRVGEPVKPLRLFLQSNNYLALVFCALAVDSAIGLPTLF